MRRTSFAGMQCSVARTLEVVGDWWTPLVLRDLSLGIGRFEEMVEDLGIPRDVLANRLDRLVEHGMVERRRYCERPPRCDYVLTESGRDFVPVLLAMAAWGDRWMAEPCGPPVVLQHRTCGQVTVAQVTCSACGEPLRHGELLVCLGPGARVAPGTRVVAERLPALD